MIQFRLLDREEKTIAERQSQYSSEEFDFGNYQPYEKVQSLTSIRVQLIKKCQYFLKDY